MTTATEKMLVRRLRYLWTWELFDSFFLPAVAVFTARIVQKPLGVASVCAMLLVAWLLWQGAAYWWLKLRAIRTHSDIAPRHLGWFSVFKKANWILIGLLPLFVLARLLSGAAFSSGLDVIVSLVFYSLAVLEQVNYYHYQLMYDTAADWQYLKTHKKLKPSKLSQALEK
ncbi:MAG: hypothetical protein JXR84_14060 [Anaerolineae bacterium]|nr:hypothetical protein [Anaerolineae bacterium]